MDIWTEKGNDSVRYDDLATQEDLDKFQNCKKILLIVLTSKLGNARMYVKKTWKEAQR